MGSSPSKSGSSKEDELIDTQEFEPIKNFEGEVSTFYQSRVPRLTVVAWNSLIFVQIQEEWKKNWKIPMNHVVKYFLEPFFEHFLTTFWPFLDHFFASFLDHFWLILDRFKWFLIFCRLSDYVKDLTVKKCVENPWCKKMILHAPIPGWKGQIENSFFFLFISNSKFFL